MNSPIRIHLDTLLADPVSREWVEQMAFCATTTGFASKRLRAELIENMRRQAGAVHAETATGLFEHVLAFIASGRQTIAVGPCLRAMFDMTDSRGLAWGDVRLPHPSVFVAFPGCTLPIGRGPGRAHIEASGMYLRIEDNNGALLHFMPWGYDPSGKGEDGFQLFSLRVLPGEPIVDLYDRAVADVRERNATVMTDAQVDTVHAMLRWALSAFLYLSCPDAEARIEERGGVDRATRRRLEREGRPLPIMARSRSVVTWLAPTTEKVGLVALQGAGGPKARHAVRGHWRHQPVGPRAEGRCEMRWIRPHWRGTDLAGQVEARTYRIREEETK